MKIGDRRLWLMAAAVVAAGCASSGGKPPSVKPPATGAAALTPPALAVKRFTRIPVNADCSATIDDGSIVGKRNKKIGWLVEDNGCNPGHDWHVELVFDDRDWNNGQNRTVKIDADDFKSIKIHPQAEPTTPGMGRKYKVWLVQTGFLGLELRRDLVIDPEVDIQM